ncbi:MAG: fumarylacetoacetate hydrolase family protein, partial [Myxococcales bacterium]|nr:fumarylacetoacetate hydrolase family protein [Myxococcales bacterium]
MQVSTSNKIVCLARSFRLHAAELGNEVPGEPLYFLKAPSAVIGPGDAIVLPPESGDVQHEAEVAIIIGRRLSRADEAEVEAAIAGWTVLNDVTARDVQKADGGRFTRAKGFDTFCPIADTQLPKLDWRSARVQCFVNGKKRQDGGLSDLLWPPAVAVAAISKGMTLRPGDVVSLGTPAGVSTLQPGDDVEVRLVDGAGAID